MRPPGAVRIDELVVESLSRIGFRSKSHTLNCNSIQWGVTCLPISCTFRPHPVTFRRGNGYIGTMRFSITQKLVLAFLGLTSLVLIATLGLARWSFERGFLDYVNTLEQNRLEWMRDALAREYEASGGNWDSMTPEQFEDLLGYFIAARARQFAEGHLSEPPRGSRPPGPPEGKPPGRPAGSDSPPGGRPPSGNRPDRLMPPTVLYDADQNRVAGTALDDSVSDIIRVAIVVDGETVGELRSEPRRRLSSPQDTAFSRQQLEMSWTIGVVALLVAAGLSFALARGLLAPIRRMIASVDRLSDGDYSTRLNERRNDELGQLMADLDHLGMTLDEERISRRRWLADVSHELKTPLTVLSGEIEALRDGIRSFDAEQLKSLDQEVQRLRFLIDDLYELSVSDVGGLRYTFSAIDLKDSLESAVNMARKRAHDNGLALEIRAAESVPIKGDVNRIDQLFQNLFENTIAYTDAPGRIEVGLSRRNGLAIVEIEDTAPGPSQADCDRLFEPLYRQESSRNRRTGGAGLGLAICRNIVEAHRGTITASPSSLGGLCLRIEMPTSNEVPE